MHRLLIIEDDKDLQEGLAFSLEAEGYETICAGSKGEGMDQLRKEACQLVLLDCNLPDGRWTGEAAFPCFCPTPLTEFSHTNSRICIGKQGGKDGVFT